MHLKKWIIPAALVLAVLAGAWRLGAPEAPSESSAAPEEQLSTQAASPESDSASASLTPPEETTLSGNSEEPETVPSQEKAPVPENAPDSQKPQPETPAQPPEEAGSAEPVCTLSIRCDTIWENPDQLDSSKAGLVPEDGVLYAETTCAFAQGESVFDLLLRETRSAGLHLEFVNTPVYGSAYIEGIGNLYEFDCGPLSGWVYSVNGAFPNYGCSKYTLQDGDQVVWQYTCDLGADVGGDNGAWS